MIRDIWTVLLAILIAGCGGLGHRSIVYSHDPDAPSATAPLVDAPLTTPAVKATTTTTAASVPAIPAGGGTFTTDESKAHAVLRNYCSSCHNGSSPAGGIGAIDSPSYLSGSGLVIPGDAEGSRLMRVLKEGRMPPPPLPAPAASELAIVAAWIAGSGPHVSATPALSNAEVTAAVAADLASAASDAPFFRYLTFASIQRTGISDRELGDLRLGLSGLINSMSWAPEMHVPVAVDKGGSVVRIDLRKLQWTAEAWDSVAMTYPYAQEQATPEFSALAATTGSKRPIVRADWFAEAAGAPAAYYRFLALGKRLGDLESRLGVDVHANLERTVAGERLVQRAGFFRSGISRSNRVMDRHAYNGGAYWRSYDFNDEAGSERKNIFEAPLGPSTLGLGGFEEDGGEVIFNLPNGLQAYALANADCTLIEEAPVQIVYDTKRNSAITAGGACIGCHADGIKDKFDEVLAFNESPSAEVKSLYTDKATLAPLLAADRARFGAALEKIGLTTGRGYLMQALPEYYRRDVTLDTAAAELGTTTSQLTAAAADFSGEAARLWRFLGTAPGAVERERFAAGYEALSQALQSITRSNQP